jgi:AMP phosphorylase
MDFELISQPIDIEAGGKYFVVLNENWANHNGIYAGDRIIIRKDEYEFIGIVSTSDVSIKSGEIGIFEEIERQYGIQKNDIVKIKRIEETDSIHYIREKLNNKKLSKEKINVIIKEIVSRRLSLSEITAFAVSTYTREWDIEEITNITSAMVDSGNKIDWGMESIANKHSLGGVLGNRTTMIIVPIIAAAGIKIPKTSSRAITSPAGTADVMEVLAKVTFNSSEIKEIVEKTNGCIVWGGKVDLAPADSVIIEALNPLRLDPVPLTLASIMSKKKASGTTHLVIDLPYGKFAKITSKKDAEKFKNNMVKIAEKLNIKIDCQITDGSAPIGNGIGPILEARDVLKVLERQEDRPRDLEQKAVMLAESLFLLLGKEKKGKAKELLDSKKALSKFKEIIERQKGDPNITSSDLQLAEYQAIVKASKSGQLKEINGPTLGNIARRLGCPGIKESGLFIHKHVNEKVAEDDQLVTLYARNEESLQQAQNYLEENYPFVII